MKRVNIKAIEEQLGIKIKYATIAEVTKTDKPISTKTIIIGLLVIFALFLFSTGAEKLASYSFDQLFDSINITGSGAIAISIVLTVVYILYSFAMLESPEGDIIILTEGGRIYFVPRKITVPNISESTFVNALDTYHIEQLSTDFRKSHWHLKVMSGKKEINIWLEQKNGTNWQGLSQIEGCTLGQFVREIKKLAPKSSFSQTSAATHFFVNIGAAIKFLIPIAVAGFTAYMIADIKREIIENSSFTVSDFKGHTCKYINNEILLEKEPDMIKCYRLVKASMPGQIDTKYEIDCDCSKINEKVVMQFPISGIALPINKYYKQELIFAPIKKKRPAPIKKKQQVSYVGQTLLMANSWAKINKDVLKVYVYNSYTKSYRLLPKDSYSLYFKWKVFYQLQPTTGGFSSILSRNLNVYINYSGVKPLGFSH